MLLNTTCKDKEFLSPVQGGGWLRKTGGIIVAWKLGETHRMRRLLQRWEAPSKVGGNSTHEDFYKEFNGPCQGTWMAQEFRGRIWYGLSID